MKVVGLGRAQPVFDAMEQRLDEGWSTDIHHIIDASSQTLILDFGQDKIKLNLFPDGTYGVETPTGEAFSF